MASKSRTKNSVLDLMTGWRSVALHVFITGLSVPATFAIIFWKTEECQYLIRLMKRILQKALKKVRKMRSTA